MELGHAIYCFEEVGAPLPTSIWDLFTDIKRRKNVLALASEKGRYPLILSTDGYNLVRHALPRKKK